jgi:hypothetical protein
MQIEKMRYKDGEGAELAWSVPNGQDREKCAMKSEDAPRQGFVDALEALKSIVVDFCELPKSKQFAEKVAVTTLSVSRDVHGNRGFIISATVRADAGAYAISTPRLRVGDETETPGPATLSEDALELVEELIAQAEQYIKGDREQGELKLEDRAPDEPTGESPYEESVESEELAGVH